MTFPKCIAAFLLLLATVQAAFAELPPYVYKERQEQADEAVIVKVQSVKTVQTKQPDETQSDVAVIARVEKVERTKSGLSEGATIRISYTRHDWKQPRVGPSELPILSKDQVYRAFLSHDKNGKDYAPAAGSHSFETVK